MSLLVKHYMSKKVPTVEGNVSVTEAAKVMKGSAKGFLIVLKDGQPSGIVTERDFVNKVVADEKNPEKIYVAEIMSSPLVTIDPDEDLLKASEIMHKHNIRRLPVVKEGNICGVITARDIVLRFGEYVEHVTQDLMRWSSPFTGIRDF